MPLKDNVQIIRTLRDTQRIFVHHIALLILLFFDAWRTCTKKGIHLKKDLIKQIQEKRRLNEEELTRRPALNIQGGTLNMHK